MINKKYLLGITTVIIISLFGILTIIYLDTIDEEQIEPKKLKILVIPWPTWNILNVAEEKGFFKNNNVDVELIPDEYGAQSKSKYFTTDIDAITTVYNDIFLMNSVYDESKIVFASDFSVDGDFILSKFDSFEKLKGKKIGIVEKFGFSHYFVLMALEKNGIDVSDVTLITLPVEDMRSSILNGAIDAGHSWLQPDENSADDEGLFVIAHSSDTPGIITDGILIKTRSIEEKYDSVQKMIKSYNEALIFCKDNRIECAEIISSVIDWSVDDVLSNFDSLKILTLEDNHRIMQDIGDDDSLYETGKFAAGILIEANHIEEVNDFSKYIEPRFVQNLME